MKIKGFVLFTLALIITTLTGCTSTNNQTAEDDSYIKLTAQEAKAMMDGDDEIIVLDVRTQEEYDSGHIEGAILIPENEISKTAETVLTDKDAKILVYCRSGRRSAQAAEKLVELGYTSIYDFGGINSWEYDIVIK